MPRLHARGSSHSQPQPHHHAPSYEEGRFRAELLKLEQTSTGSGTLFSDQEFPPVVESLIDRRDVPPFVDDVPKFTKQTEWKRATDIWSCNNKDNDKDNDRLPVLYTRENLHPAAVRQGGLENCYFLAALTSLTLHPDRVTRLFLSDSNSDNTSLSSNGIYAVRFFCNGQPNEIVVDDWLPTKKDDGFPTSGTAQTNTNIPKDAKVSIQSQTDNGDGTQTIVTLIEYANGRLQLQKSTIDIVTPSSQLKFSKTSTRLGIDELWVSIIEKAYAKIQGTYAALEAGNHYETLRDLTGAPGFFYTSVDSNSHSFDVLQDYFRQGFPMSCGIDYTYNMPWSMEQLDQVGLLPMHAYSILAVCTVTVVGNGSGNDKTLQQQRLIKLRNPWGDAKEWRGDWSNQSPLWTENIRRQIQHQGIPMEADPTALDGIFWMPWEQFCRYYNSWDVNKYHESFQFSAVVLPDNPAVGYHLLKVFIQQSGHYTFGISQISSRTMAPSTKYQYSSVRGILVRAQGGNDNRAPLANCQFVKGVCGEQRDEYIEPDQFCAPGMYLLFVQVWWDPSSKHLLNREISVNCYGTARIKFAQDLAPSYDKIEVLTEIFASKVRREMVEDSSTTSDINDNASQHVLYKSRGQPTAQAIQEYFNNNKCEEGYHFHLFCNTETENIVLQEEKQFAHLQGAELVAPVKNTPTYSVVSGSNAYSICVAPGETKGVFLMVKKTFSMASPIGTASLKLSNGQTELEKEATQTYVTSSSSLNIPTSTGTRIRAKFVPPVELTTLYTGGGKGAVPRGKRRRRSTVLKSMLASIRSSPPPPPPPPPPPTTTATQSAPPKANNSNKRIFGRLFGKKKAQKQENDVAMVPPATDLSSVPAPVPADPVPQQEQRVDKMDSATNDTSTIAAPQHSKLDSIEEPFFGSVRQFNKEAEDNVDLIIIDETPVDNPIPRHGQQLKKKNRLMGKDDATLPTNGESTKYHVTPKQESSAAKTSTATSQGYNPSKDVRVEEDSFSSKMPITTAASPTQTPQKPKPPLFAKYFGGHKQRSSKSKGRKATLAEAAILSRFPELKDATILENNRTTTEKTLLDGTATSTTTITTLRVII